MNLSTRTKTLLLALSLGATSNAQAHIEAILSSPNQALMAQQESLWTVLFTNSGDHVETFVAPAQLNAYWQQGEERHVLSFQRHSAENPSQLKPQAVMPVMYSVTLPQGLDAGIASVYLQELPDRAVTVVLAQDDSALIAAVDDQGQIITDHATTDDEADATPFVQVAATNESIDEDVGRNNFIDNFYAYEPLYFLFGTDPNNAKFQISFKYRFVDDDSEFAQEHPWLSSFYVAYTQTSFWDLESESAPFRDTNFKPEVFYQFNDVRLPTFSDDAYFDFRFGYQHESNGQDGDESRSLNIGYFEPAFHWNITDRYRLSVAPRVWTYVGGRDGNEDIRDFRGRSSLTATITQKDGFQLETYLRGNPGTGNGSLQLDLSYPISALSFLNLDFYAYGQFFTGYGESLLDYNRKDTRFRLGLGIVR